MKPKRSAVPVLLALTGVAALATVFFLTGGRDAADHSKAAGAFYELAYADATILQEVAHHGDNELRSFDALVRGSDRIDQALGAVVEAMGDAVHNKSIDFEVKAIRVLIDRRQGLIERLKSTTAIVRNSLMRVGDILDAIEHLNRDLVKHSKRRAVVKSLHEMLPAYIASPSTEKAAALTELLADLAKIPALVPAEQRSRAIFIAAHVPVLVSTKDLQRRLETDILNIDVASATKTLHASYERLYDVSSMREKQLSWFLFLTCIALVPYCAYAFIQQRALNQTLDAKVVERTLNLMDLNRALSDEIAERKKAQLAMEGAQQQLVQSSKLAALGEMAGGIAHEINNPIAIITMRAVHIKRLLSEEAINRDLILKFTTVIGDTAERISKIVNGLRTFSRSGAADPMVPSFVRSIVDDSVALCGERFRMSGISLSVDCVAADLAILCRPVEVSQVLVNLLNNAFDAIKDFKGEKWIKIEARPVGESVEIVVSDAGVGIPQKVREKIFEPFFTTKDVGSGTGLGLSVSLGIVRNHGGEIRIDDTAPNTSFVIRMPRAAA